MAAAPAEPNAASVEALFRPSTRFRDSNLIEHLPEGWTEIELLPGLSLENVRATRLTTWDAFHSFARQKLVWMTPDVYVCIFNGYLPGRVLTLGASESTTSMRVYVTPGTAAATATATCDFLVRLLATCEERDLDISGGDRVVATPLSGASLSLFFQESREVLRKVVLSCMVLSEELCLALATMSRLDVEVTLDWCSLADDSAGAFVECLQSDRGPVNLHCCKIDGQIIANALTGDSRVTRLQPPFVRTDDAIMLRALANNRGLVYLYLPDHSISDENWTILCQSLKAHPTLTSLNLEYTVPRGQKTHRTRALVEMVQRNTVLHSIQLAATDRHQKIFREEIRPKLETNLYRPRVRAIKKTKDRPFREKLLGRALHSVRSNPNLVWMLLSENVDAFVRSEEEEEESNSEVPVAVAAAVVVAAAGSKRKR
jgi:hypothetical protein